MGSFFKKQTKFWNTLAVSCMYKPLDVDFDLSYILSSDFHQIWSGYISLYKTQNVRLLLTYLKKQKVFYT